MKKLNVLIIEDNEADAVLAKEIVMPAIGGGKIYTADRLSAARDAWLKHPDIDVAVLDLSLPDSTGWNTLFEFRQIVGDLPIVVFATSTGPSGSLRPIVHGVSRVLLKDDRESLLRDAIVEAVEEHSTRDELSSRLTNRFTALATAFNEVTRMVESITVVISGNGRGGIVSRLARLEVYFGILSAMWVVGLIVLIAIFLVLWSR